jgi:hypothetical protein
MEEIARGRGAAALYLEVGPVDNADSLVKTPSSRVPPRTLLPYL